MLLDTVSVICPYCWQQIEIVIDLSDLPVELTEDCSVCCQPMLLNAAHGADDRAQVEVARENG